MEMRIKELIAEVYKVLLALYGFFCSLDSKDKISTLRADGLVYEGTSSEMKWFTSA